ncbi:MAG: hypothetical protein AB7S68_18290 [Polyangiaceae bacterium]
MSDDRLSAPPPRSRFEGWCEPWIERPWLWLAIAAVMGIYVSRAILSNVGEPAVPLDDSYIHFNYARSFARLHPLVYSPGAPATTGATSLGWVLALSVGWLLGLHELKLIYLAWALGWLCCGLLAWETARLTRGLLRPSIGLVTGLLVFTFSPHTWFAASGMEVLPLAWLLMRTARLCAEAWEQRSAVGYLRAMLATSFCAAITRPEGVLAALMVAVTLFFVGGGFSRRYAAAALVGPVIPPGLNWLATGQMLSATAQAKLLSTSPYATQDSAWDAQLGNLKLFFRTLLNGEVWADGMIPTGVWWLPCVGLIAIGLVGGRKRARTVLILCVAAGALIPTAYWTFLVNRLRYIWPFAAAWLIGLGAIAELAARLLERALQRSRVRGAARWLGVALAASAGYFLAAEVPGTLKDLITSCAAIHGQQVSLARWAKAELPKDAAIGVNDAGAIAYLSDHPTVDLVGLTTRGEATYWRAGPGPRFEHYEKAKVLPPYLILYPSWLDIDAITGLELTRRSVWGASILGAPEMVALETRFDLLGSGAGPPSPGKLIDELDVCDLESEAAHDYQLFFAHEGTNTVRVRGAKADGGRTYRSLEEFNLELSPGGLLWMRGGAEWPLTLKVRVDGREIGNIELEGFEWEESWIRLPTDVSPGVHRVRLERQSQVWFTSMHFWVLE